MVFCVKIFFSFDFDNCIGKQKNELLKKFLIVYP